MTFDVLIELAAAFLPHVRLVLSHYQTDNVLSMLKFGLIKRKGRYLAILISMLPGRKRQWFDNHITDMPDVICSENFFKRTSWSFNLSFNLCILQQILLQSQSFPSHSCITQYLRASY